MIAVEERRCPMAEHELECNECGWQGTASALDKQQDAAGAKTLRFCPDCGGTDLRNATPKEKTEGSAY